MRSTTTLMILRSAAVSAAVLAATAAGAAVPSPKDVLGIEVGRDRVLADYAQTREYLTALAAASPRVQVLDMGATVDGRQMIAAVISAPANLSRLDASHITDLEFPPRKSPRLVEGDHLRTGEFFNVYATLD